MMDAPAPDRGLESRLLHGFEACFGGRPSLVARAPGRVNLIGDHTDYNGGFVLPMAIDRVTLVAARPRTDGRVVVHALDLGETRAFMLGEEARSTGWVEYLRGVAWALAEAGHAPRTGWEGVIAGDVPMGAGLSSSASLELATARVFADIDHIAWEAMAMARIAQRAENAWVGVNCGIMDQLISAAGVSGHALLIDCRSLDRRAVRLPHDAAVVVLDTATRRGLVDSAYNARRAQCETAAAVFGVASLREVSRARLEAEGAALDAETRRRARHAITESERTVAAAEALAAGDVARVGALMDASHASLRDDFEVSRAELDTMVTLARAHPACLGARMTGAGFGGCAVALVRRDGAAAFADAVGRAYAARTGLEPLLYVCEATEGATSREP